MDEFRSACELDLESNDGASVISKTNESLADSTSKSPKSPRSPRPPTGTRERSTPLKKDSRSPQLKSQSTARQLSNLSTTSSNIPLPIGKNRRGGNTPNSKVSNNSTTNRTTTPKKSPALKKTITTNPSSTNKSSYKVTDKHTLEIQYLKKHKCFVQLKNELTDKQKSIAEMYQDLLQKQKRLSELGKDVELDEMKLICGREYFKLLMNSSMSGTSDGNNSMTYETFEVQLKETQNKISKLIHDKHEQSELIKILQEQINKLYQDLQNENTRVEEFKEHNKADVQSIELLRSKLNESNKLNKNLIQANLEMQQKLKYQTIPQEVNSISPPPEFKYSDDNSCPECAENTLKLSKSEEEKLKYVEQLEKLFNKINRLEEINQILKKSNSELLEEKELLLDYGSKIQDLLKEATKKAHQQNQYTKEITKELERKNKFINNWELVLQELNLNLYESNIRQYKLQTFVKKLDKHLDNTRTHLYYFFNNNSNFANRPTFTLSNINQNNTIVPLIDLSPQSLH